MSQPAHPSHPPTTTVISQPHNAVHSHSHSQYQYAFTPPSSDIPRSGAYNNFQSLQTYNRFPHQQAQVQQQPVQQVQLQLQNVQNVQNDQFISYSHIPSSSSSPTSASSSSFPQSFSPQYPAPVVDSRLVKPLPMQNQPYQKQVLGHENMPTHMSEIQAISSPISTTASNPQMMSPATSINSMNMMPPQYQYIQGTLPLSAMSVNTTHRRTRVFWSRRDMDNLIGWIEKNKPDCIGHGRRQDCERIKKEVFQHRTEFSAKTIKEKLLNMEKKYKQARLIKLNNGEEKDKEEKSDKTDKKEKEVKEEEEDDASTKDDDDTEEGAKFGIDINNPRFEGLSLKDRIEKICPFFDRIDRLKSSLANTSTHPSSSTTASPALVPSSTESLANYTIENDPSVSQQQIYDPLFSQSSLQNAQNTQQLSSTGQKRPFATLQSPTLESLITILERRELRLSHESTERMKLERRRVGLLDRYEERERQRIELEQKWRSEESQHRKKIEIVIKNVLSPSFFVNTSPLSGQADLAEDQGQQNVSKVRKVIEGHLENIEPVVLSKSLETTLSSSSETSDSTHEQSVVASALAAATSAFVTTMKMGVGIPFDKQYTQSNPNNYFREPYENLSPPKKRQMTSSDTPTSQMPQKDGARTVSNYSSLANLSISSPEVFLNSNHNLANSIQSQNPNPSHDINLMNQQLNPQLNAQPQLQPDEYNREYQSVPSNDHLSLQMKPYDGNQN